MAGPWMSRQPSIGQGRSLFSVLFDSLSPFSVTCSSTPPLHTWRTFRYAEALSSVHQTSNNSLGTHTWHTWLVCLISRVCSCGSVDGSPTMCLHGPLLIGPFLIVWSSFLLHLCWLYFLRRCFSISRFQISPWLLNSLNLFSTIFTFKNV